MNNVLPDREELLHKVVEIVQRLTADWDLGDDRGIGADTRLIGDLSFESIDVVQFIVALEEGFHRRDFPFERLLMSDGRYVDELTVGQVVDFLDHALTELQS
ncbi:MAG: hypothetical protein K1X74_08785 [Pirellulales bacterium]|nr:hypothetical protein [Pirellulales bacterium]